MTSLPLSTYTISLGPIAESLLHVLDAQPAGPLFVLVDENTETCCWPLVEPLVAQRRPQLIRIPAGEAHKHIGSCQHIWQQLLDAEAGRDALLLNLGGGVIGDMGGFCAGAYKRGIRFVQIPTTLLSQVDASIGGKLGIDFGGVKNSIGLFQDPLAVLIDPAFLGTLPPRELRSGLAEVLKHSLIADAGQWAELRQLGPLETVEDWARYLLPSLRIKQRIVEADPFEKGIRKALNFGHTIGHAVESWALEGPQPLLHGEAIAIGMISEAYLSHRLLGLPWASVEAVAQTILPRYGHCYLDPGHYPTLLALMRNDKKNAAGQINFSLINPLGQAAIDQTCTAALISESLDFYNSLKS
jgi:3-dehydroquinate synthase